MKLIHFPDAHDQKLGVENDRLDKVFKTEPDKKIVFHAKNSIWAGNCMADWQFWELCLEFIRNIYLGKYK